MAVYFLGQLRTDGWGWYKEYKATTEKIVEKYGGKYLIKGGQSHLLEGDRELPSAFVVIEFPDAKSARGFYEDPDYAPMIELRKSSGVETESAIVDGFAEAASTK